MELITIKNLNTLKEANEERFSKAVSFISVDDPESYEIIITAITNYNNYTSTQKGNYGKLPLEISNDLKTSLRDFILMEGI